MSLPGGRPVHTLRGHRDAPMAKRARGARRVGVGLLVALVGLGLLGFFGPRTATVSDEGTGGWRLAVDYPHTIRSGQATPLRIRVTRDRPITEPVTIRADAGLFDRLDFQNWFPNPSAETADGQKVSYEFDPPGAATLRIDLDARTAPTQGPSAHRYTIEVMDGDPGGAAASVSFRIRVMP